MHTPSTTHLTPPRAQSPRSALPWKRLLLPTEHGSWALTFEPVALGLLVAPSMPAVCVAGAVAAAFLARKPAKLGWGASCAKSPVVRDAAQTLALSFCTLAMACVTLAYRLTGVLTLTPLLLAVPGVLYFAWCDRTGRTRSLSAEMIGTAVCALPLAAMALASGNTIGLATGLATVAVARSLPTLLLVRTCLRRNRGETVSTFPAWFAQFAAIAALACAAGAHWLPWLAVIVALGLVLRSAYYLAPNGSRRSARTLGVIETGAGVVYLSLQAFAFAIV